MPSFDQVVKELERQAIELPSWAFGNSGTRFKVFPQPGVPRDPFEKVADAAKVHELTGLAPSVALHIPWDRVDDFDVLRKHADGLGVRLGTINSNTFQDEDYKFGSLCHIDERVRTKAIAHMHECVDIMDATGSRDLKIWLPDGLNYPGQGDLRDRQDRLADSLAQVYERVGEHQRLVLEYKFFEPAFYATDVPDWGTAYAQCVALGERAVVCLDTGHHAPGTNIEFIVMQLLRLGRLGSFDFNSRFYADDDLIVGAADPFQLFRILFEVVRGGGYEAESDVAFMLDQCHNIEAKIPGQIRSVLNVQEMLTRALLVDRDALGDAEAAGDVLGGHHVLMDAFYTDVRADLAEWRVSRGLPADPVQAYLASGYADQIAADRAGGNQAGVGRVNDLVRQLLDRSHRLGADKRNTNYAGGNTSAKGTDVDPVTGEPIELMWVKGSGGDLGTLTEAGLSVLRVDRLRALTDAYPGPEREDEMVAAFDFCGHGKGGAAPSIDTAMHGLVGAAHVDHLHPDSGIAIATAADGERLTKEVFGGKVAWVPWRRPGFQLGLDIAAIHDADPGTIGVVLGGHGITAWGATSDEAEANSLWMIRTAADYVERVGRPDPFGSPVAERGPLPVEDRRARAAALAPHVRAIASTDHSMIGHFTDDDVVLEFLASENLSRLAGLGTSCPDHFIRTKVRPLVVDLPSDASIGDCVARLAELHAAYRDDYRGYYERNAGPDSPAMRGADPAIVLVPGVGMFSFGKDKQTARVAGEFYVNAINVMRGAEAISTYQPIPEAEKFRIEYWALEEAKLQRMPEPRSHAGRIAFVTGAASGIGKAIATRLAAEGACVVVADLDLERAQSAASAIGDTDVAIGVRIDVADRPQVSAAIDAAVLAFGGVDLVVNNAGLSISKPLAETTEADWDLLHDVLAKGSFLVSQAAARVLVAQRLGGDIVYISSKNAVFAGPANLAYSAAKANQAHQVRLLAAELGEHGIKVNGINPDGVVRGSGIFADGWGAQRAAVYGVPEDELGAFYAQRTLLKREVLPEHVANAVAAITSDEFTHTTGLHVPVDAGVAAAFFVDPVSERGERRVVAAIDIGASGGRVMAGIVEAGRVSLDPVHRFPNGVAEVDGHVRWNFTALFEQVLEGLARLAATYPEVESIGIDTWAVDYGLLDADDRLLAEPISYRDPRTGPAVARVHALVPPDELFERNGLQFLPFNTLYQLAAEQEGPRWAEAAHVVLLPDLLAFWLTGVLGTEFTNATTTGLVDVRTGQWSAPLLDRLAIPEAMLPPIEQPGSTRGTLLPHIAEWAGMPASTVVATVGSHDTASAVVGVPAHIGEFAYIASGTWSLVGLELDEPILTLDARRANFTNEGGVDHRVRFLRNVGGLWLLQESMRTWAAEGAPHDLTELLGAAAALPSGGPTIDVDDDALIAPDDMPDRIAAAVTAAGHRAPPTPAETVRCVLDSLASAHARAIAQASETSGQAVKLVHVVGGGSQNRLLCQLTADAIDRPVVAGPVEATALGNVLVQARAIGATSGTLEDLRAMAAASTELTRYEPRPTW